jgi:Tol biopolymer transport system component
MSWTRDGRLVFTRHADDGSIELWVMDANGGNQAAN